MSNYLNKYKGTYRVIAPYDLVTHDFPRESSGDYATNDVYIKCEKGGQIFYYGKGILEFYCPNKERGHNILKAMKKDGTDQYIIKLEESDKELLIQFKDSNFSILSTYFKPSTYGASVSPFSVKNLPKTKYTIPEEDIKDYKTVVLPLKENTMQIARLNKEFIELISSKKNPVQAIRDDMKKKGLKGKNYFHAIGLWDRYINFLTKKVGEYVCENS